MHTTRPRRSRSRSSAATTATRPRLLAEDDPVLRGARASPTPRAGSSRAGRRSTARSRSSCACSTPAVTDALDKGHLRTPDRRGPAAGRRPRLRQRLPDLRRPPLPHRRARPAGRAHRRRRQGSSRATTTRASPPRSASTADFVVGTHRRRSSSTPRPRWCSRCTPATPRPTTRWPGRWGGGAPLVLAAPCCHHDVAAQLRDGPDARAVRRADPARHPARAVRRHPDRRAAGLAAAAGRATASTSWSSSRASTPRATPCCARCAPAAPRRPGSARGVRRPGRAPGGAARGSAELLGRAPA